MRTFVRRAALATAAMATLGAPASGADHPQDALKLVLRSSLGSSKAVYVTKVPFVTLPAEEPFIVGGSFTIKAQSGETATFPMPASNWSANASGTLYRFTNRDAPTGPSEVKVALIKSGSVLKVVAQSSGITLDEESQESVSVTLTIGSDRWCSTCGALSIRKDEPGKFIARGCAAVPCASPSGAFLDE